MVIVYLKFCRNFKGFRIKFDNKLKNNNKFLKKVQYYLYSIIRYKYGIKF